MKILLTFSNNHVTFNYRFLDQNGRSTTFIELPVACSRFLRLLYSFKGIQKYVVDIAKSSCNFSFQSQMTKIDLNT